MFFGLFGKKKAPAAQEIAQKPAVQNNNSVSANSDKNNSASAAIQKTPAQNNAVNNLRPGPNGCADIATREE